MAKKKEKKRFLTNKVEVTLLLSLDLLEGERGTRLQYNKKWHSFFFFFKYNSPRRAARKSNFSNCPQFGNANLIDELFNFFFQLHGYAYLTRKKKMNCSTEKREGGKKGVFPSSAHSTDPLSHLGVLSILVGVQYIWIELMEQENGHMEPIEGDMEPAFFFFSLLAKGILIFSKKLSSSKWRKGHCDILTFWQSPFMASEWMNRSVFVSLFHLDLVIVVFGNFVTVVVVIVF